MKNRRGEYLYFCSAEQDSLYALTFFRKKEKQGTLNVQETGLLLCMEQRAEDSWIYLMPAAVYAAANQKGARSWMNRQKQEKIDLWNEKGIAWMRRYPVFLEQFGWKQRRYAILAAGIFEQLEEESMDEFEKGKNQVCHFLQGSWGFLWKRIQQCDRLSVQEWKEMKAPWKDSVRMDCAMSGILLLMAQLLKKELEERDRLCVGFMKLQQFTQESLRTNVSLRNNLQRYRELNQWMHAVQKSVLWALVRIPPRLSNPKRWDGCSRNFAIRSALLISMKKGGFPVNGWNSCIRLWSWRDFRQEHLKRSAFLRRR